MIHLTPEQISDYIMSGEFPVDELMLRTAREHLDACPDCRGIYDRMKVRFDGIRLPAPEAHIRMLNDKAKRMEKRSGKLRYAFRAAAAVLLLISGYGTASWLVNRNFDHSPLGLADLRSDYEFAVIPSAYRGETGSEREDIRLYKEGVLTLFASKTNAFGLLPSYDLDRVEQADRYFEQSERITGDAFLKERLTVFRERIRLVKKEIRK